MSGLTRPTSERASQQRFHIALLSALVLVLAGCAAFRGVGGTPEPTTNPTPTASPETTSTPQPTTTPTATPFGTIEHPTRATDVVLRMEWGGGFVPMQSVATQMPQFTLYGDGTVVFRPLPVSYGGGFAEPSPPFVTGDMSEQDVQELLGFALNEGGLTNAKTSYDYPGIADAGTVMFTVNAGGVDKTVSIYALMQGTIDGPDQADRAALNELQQRLNNFETEANDGAVEMVRDYDPNAYKAVMFDTNSGSPADGVEPVDWPWKDIQPSDFVAADESSWATRFLSRDQTARLTDVPNGGQMSIWVTAPDESLVDFSIRPLLPDEMSTLPD